MVGGKVRYSVKDASINVLSLSPTCARLAREAIICKVVPSSLASSSCMLRERSEARALAWAASSRAVARSSPTCRNHSNGETHPLFIE